MYLIMRIKVLHNINIFILFQGITSANYEMESMLYTNGMYVYCNSFARQTKAILYKKTRIKCDQKQTIITATTKATTETTRS